MLKIRLQRIGRKHEPVFRLVVVDSQRSPKSGNFLEILGNFDSRKAEQAKFDNEKIKHWLAQGAQTSGTVHNLLVSRKIIDGKKINVLPKKQPIVKESDKAAETAQPSQVKVTEEAKGQVENEASSASTEETKSQTEEVPVATEEPVSQPNS